jgi:hypothetical protein
MPQDTPTPSASLADLRIAEDCPTGRSIRRQGARELGGLQPTKAITASVRACRAEQVLSDGTRMRVLARERGLPAEAGGPRRRVITPCIKINPADGERRQSCPAACCTNGADA